LDRLVKGVAVGSRLIEDGGRCFVIAEIGVNHDGNPDTAHALIEAACESGADAVKFQLFKAEVLASRDAPLAEYQSRANVATSQVEMLTRLELAPDILPSMAEHARRLGLAFIVSPFDEESARQLISQDVDAIKIASGELTNHLLLRQLSSGNRPLIVSTGMSTLTEVEDAMRVMTTDGAQSDLVLLHCVSRYPAPAETANLRAIQTMRHRFHLPIGFSDHTLGTTVALAAVALGACVIEKHLTYDIHAIGPDHAASIEPSEFATMVRSIRVVESAIGDGVKQPAPGEDEIAMVARKSLYVRNELGSGQSIKYEDLMAMRPGTGISPSRSAELIGRRVKRALPRLTQLQWDDLN
jgi:N,N'-diacetyllegionaminate synthase